MRNVALLLKASSYKKEITTVLGTLAFILVLPIFAVLTIADSGVSAASDALAALNPVSHMVEVRDSKGNIVAQLQTTTVWPVKGNVTTEFGEPDPPYQTHHTGIDIADKIGDPITTFMEGTVIQVENNPDNPRGYGKYVTISHGNSITSLYGHMSQTNVTIGQTVKPGDVIGLEGSTGHSTGAHVHFEIRVSDIPVNPRIFMIGDPPRA